MKNHLTRFLFALLMGTSSLSFAEIKPDTFEVTPFIGGTTFDGVSHLETRPTVGLRLGYDFTRNLAAELAGAYTPTELTKADKNVDVFNYHFDLLYHLFPENRLVPFVAAGFGGMRVPSGLEKKDTAIANYGLGAKYFLNDDMALRGDVRHIIKLSNNDQTRNDLEYTVGLAFLFGKPKPVPAPAPAPEPAPAPVVKPAPAPAPPLAPTANLAASPSTVTAGSSATLTWSSKNASDCSIQPGIGPVQPQGSMKVTPAADTAYTLSCSGPGGSTSSNASVAVTKPQPPAAPTSNLTVTPKSVTKGGQATLAWNSKNATNCAIQPEIGPVAPQGSMKITPAADTAYTLTCNGAGGTVKSSDSIKVTIPEPPAAPKKEKICITLGVEFKTAKADIQPKYHDEIGKVAEFLKKYPEATGVIEGHTDNVGGKEYNQKLSQRRAESVRDYLISKYGIDASRLSAKGYGLTKPIADNSTPEGRQKNRRILATFDCVIIVK